MKTCIYCDGSGWNSSEGETCYDCDGSGVKKIIEGTSSPANWILGWDKYGRRHNMNRPPTQKDHDDFDEYKRNQS